MLCQVGTVPRWQSPRRRVTAAAGGRSGRVLDFIPLLLEKLWTDLLDSCMTRSAIQFLAGTENLTSIARSAAHIALLPSVDKAGVLKPFGYFHF